VAKAPSSTAASRLGEEMVVGFVIIGDVVASGWKE